MAKKVSLIFLSDPLELSNYQLVYKGVIVAKQRIEGLSEARVSEPLFSRPIQFVSIVCLGLMGLFVEIFMDDSTFSSPPSPHRSLERSDCLKAMENEGGGE